MIYGIVPVGGSACRLNLPYPKELLPLKGFDSYKPVRQITIENMVDAGCG
jgi:UTP-glucose-1-phosphate uridylyltransferase